MASSASEKPIAVYGAIVANFIIAVTKFAAAAFTGSSAMISEGIHSVVDTGNQSLLLLGNHLSKKPADEGHPFGYGKELYFWGLIVAVILFGVGGGMSVYEGITHLEHPAEIQDPLWNYVVLGFAMVVESIAFVIAYRELQKEKGDKGFWQAVRESKDPRVFVILFEDAAALAGLVIALMGVYLGHATNNPVYDAVASILIGVVLGVTAVFLAYESRLLLLGEAADRGIIESISQLASEDPAVKRIRRPLTMHFGPDEVLLNLDIQFNEDVKGADFPAVIDRLEKAIREKHPRISHIFIEVESIIKIQTT